ncbi:MAG: Ig-like domain-containing protein, partial [Leptolyngbyaceae bacterium]|nr:Ig-like domain-containing protein [Leptolyngbyaceae bacterium]
MQRMGKVIRIGLSLLLMLSMTLGIAGCNTAQIASKVEPLPAVDPLPPPQLPDWIEQISPTGEAEPLAQVRIRFKEPLIPVESLDSPNQQEALKKFEMMPPLPGQFRFLTPRMVGFQAEQALPKATRVQVTLKAGLSDLKNHRLDQDLAWTFNTETIKLTNLPGIASQAANSESNTPEAIALKPTLEITSNVELDLASVQDRTKLVPEGGNKAVSLKVTLKEEKTADLGGFEEPEDAFNPANRTWIYTLVPEQTLTKATPYRLEFNPGLRPLRGNLPSQNTFATKVATYAPLQFEQLQFEGQPSASGTYGRFVKGSAQLRFNNGLVADSAIANITINPAPKAEPQLVKAYEGDRIVSLNPWALEPAKTYTITLGANLKDQFGQTLGKPVTLKYETGDVGGDIWAPDGLHIFPPGKDLQLNISTVNLPESKYQAAYRVVQPTDLVYVDSAYPTGEGKDLLPDPANWQSFKVPNRKNQSHETTVPLQKQLGSRTGMLAYGVKARTNRYQEDGQQKWREPATYGLVQLTNLGVFAQWFPESGLVRVHHLADG